MIDLTQTSKKTDSKLINWIKNRFQFLKNSKHLFYYVLLLVGVAFGFYFLMLVNNQFTTPYSGDFVMQYIPFAYDYYDNWWSFFTTGVFPHWDTTIFLGADSITSNGYYILFSPFFALLLIFPRSWIPQVMALVSILRMVLAGAFFRCYLKKLNVSELLARLGGLAFMSCGWIAYFQWFNNFLDIAVFLPLILLGIEKVLQDKKPWLLIISLGYLGIDNFFFFPAFIIMTFVYSMFRYFQRLKLNSAKDNLLILLIGFLAYVCAIGISLVIFIPGLVTGMSDPKIEGSNYLTQLLYYFENQDYIRVFSLLFNWRETADWKIQSYPIIELFIPPTTCRHVSLVRAELGNTFVNEAGSLWVTMPILFFFFPAFINSIKKGKISHIIGVCIFIFVLFTPFSYYLLFGGGKAYSRWQIIVPACMIAYVISFLDKNKVNMTDLVLGLSFVVLGIILSGILAKYYVDNSANLTYFLPFPWMLLVEIVYVLVLFFVLLYFYEKKNFKNILVYFACFEAILIGNFVTFGHGYTNPNSGNGGAYENSFVYDASSKIKNYDDSFYRTYSSLNAQNLSDNNQNMNNYNGTAMFNTLYNFNTRDFKWWTRMSDWYGGWSASYVEKRQTLDYFLNIKYYMVNKSNTIATKIGYENISNDELANLINVPYGYEYNEQLSNDEVFVFENKNVNNIGFSFDNVFCYDVEKAQNALSGSHSYALRNDDMFLKTAIMRKEDYNLLDDDVKDDLGEPKTQALTLDETNYERVNLVDTRILPSSSGTKFVKRYYQIEDSINYNIKNLKNIFDEKPLTSSEINDDEANREGNYFITITKEELNGNLYQSNWNNCLPFSEDGEKLGIYLDAPYTTNFNVDVYLLGKNGDVIKFDNHRDDYVTNSTKAMRGFYADEDVYAIVIYPRYYGHSNFGLFFETQTNYQNKINSVTKLENQEYINSNYLKFTTDYNKHKIIVLNTPYERGWKVIAHQGDKSYELDTFMGQGGFVSFTSLVGDTSYEVIYKNADMVKVLPITNICVVLWAGSFIAYTFIDEYLKNKKYRKQLRIDI